MPLTSWSIQPTRIQDQPADPQNIIISDTFTFSIAQVAALNSTPLEFLPGLTGYVYAPLSCMIYKNGARYDTSPGVIRIQWTGYTTTFPCGNGTVMPAAYVIAADTSYLSSSFQNTGTGTEAGGKGLTITSTVGNPTVTVGNPGFPLTVLITYLLLPSISSNIVGY